jgi:hypothetical protein
VPKFGQIYQDDLPGKPLPPTTEFLLRFNILDACVACLWLMLGLFAILMLKKPSASTRIITCLLVLAGFQFGVTVWAQFLPGNLKTTGMSEQAGLK